MVVKYILIFLLNFFFCSTVHGAWMSGQRAASQLLKDVAAIDVAPDDLRAFPKTEDEKEKERMNEKEKEKGKDKAENYLPNK